MSNSFQLAEQRLRVDEVARGEAFGEPGVERGEEGAGGVALALALPEPRQAGGGAQLERLGLLPPGDLQGLAEERLRLLDRIPVHVEENLGPQPVELGIVVVLSLLLGLRDAESLFAQVMSRADAKVTEKTVREMLGIASPKHLSDFVDILAEKNLSRAISYLNKFHNDGGSPEEFLKALMNYLRELMLVKIDSALRSAVAPELTDEQFSVMIAQSKRFEQADLSAILIALMEAQDNLKKTSQPLLPVELALMKMLWK